ncbi:polyphosphate glucokinase [Sphaerisporangium krabiense]|uniref:Polyphosphate glucokinase n=1 Tax=Sphaerisporangium krabiense TaxID=763782 RepID=A0A7W8ZAX6_9ACTN|nr:ROK family protein [Sphaerisporangium krabiense]MBB5630298.1 polyphosphate glucokinase [Sphaerisporangium krabiense]GII62751.1 polyphosphate glucokinase [Sphaerisporangium krabiense]
MNTLGIDIGGSGIKGAPVDTATGTLLAERCRIPTPSPSAPGAVAEVVRRIVEHFSWTGPVGVTFPGVVVDGVTRTAANVDHAWIGTDARELFTEASGLGVVVLNDADAAGVAEATFGAGHGHEGLVLMLTFGTGIGSAMIMNGVLIPNTEFGHLEIDGHKAEHRASDHAREVHDLTWEKWAHRVQRYLEHVQMLMSPSMIIIGGGVSKKADKFLGFIDLPGTTVVPATLLNNAGIIGAALAAASAAAPVAGR